MRLLDLFKEKKKRIWMSGGANFCIQTAGLPTAQSLAG
jgi:hypothetical protein